MGSALQRSDRLRMQRSPGHFGITTRLHSTLNYVSPIRFEQDGEEAELKVAT